MIVVSGVMTFRPSVHDMVVDDARRLISDTLAEPGCRTYGFWADPDMPGRFRISEEWESQEALTAHLGSPHFAAFACSFSTGDLVDMDVHRYIDPEVKDLF